MSDEEHLPISLTVNGERVTRMVPVRQHLVDFLRTDLGLTGSHLGCEHGVCGACSVRVDGAVVRGCLMLAVQADGTEVVTIEGLAESGEIADLQEGFVARNALQCGFCTPGMLMTAAELLAAGAPATREEIRTHPLRQLLPLHRFPRHRRRRGDDAGGAPQEELTPCPTRCPTTCCAPISTGPTATSGAPCRAPAPRARWPGAAATPTTSPCRACCTPPSCAARTPTPGS